MTVGEDVWRMAVDIKMSFKKKSPLKFDLDHLAREVGAVPVDTDRGGHGGVLEV